MQVCANMHICTHIWTSQVVLVAKNPPANAGDVRSIPGLGRSSGVGNGSPLQYSCLEKFLGQRSLAGCSPWGRKESDMTGYTHTYIYNMYFRSHEFTSVLSIQICLFRVLFTFLHSIILSSSVRTLSLESLSIFTHLLNSVYHLKLFQNCFAHIVTKRTSMEFVCDFPFPCTLPEAENISLNTVFVLHSPTPPRFLHFQCIYLYPLEIQLNSFVLLCFQF